MSKDKPILSAGRPSARASKAATLTSLADSPAVRRVNFDLSVEQHIKLKIYAAEKGKSIKEVLTELVEDLDRRQQR